MDILHAEWESRRVEHRDSNHSGRAILLTTNNKCPRDIFAKPIS